MRLVKRTTILQVLHASKYQVNMAEWGRNAVALLILFNLSVNVSIVLVNKYVFDIFEFRYATTLTALHFGCTAVGLDIMGKYFGVFKPKPVPLRDIAPIAVAYAFSIPLSNLSLAYNSVGFYQMVSRMAVSAAAGCRHDTSAAWLRSPADQDPHHAFHCRYPSSIFQPRILPPSAAGADSGGGWRHLGLCERLPGGTPLPVEHTMHPSSSVESVRS